MHLLPKTKIICAMGFALALQHPPSLVNFSRFTSLSTTSCNKAIPAMFSVKRRRPELVVPGAPTPRELKPLSDIDDQEGLRFCVPLIMVFEKRSGIIMHDGNNNNNNNNKDPVGVIREALATALVFYYPLAGRLVQGPDRKLSVDCTAEGVAFVEADADATLQELGDLILQPSPNLKELLYDISHGSIVGSPILHFQVTRMKCGGFVFALYFNHTICDGYGINLFMKAVAELARGMDAPSILPVWQRDMFNARTPPTVTCAHHEFDKIPKITDIPTQNMIQGSIFIGLERIKALKQDLSESLQTSIITTFEVLVAILWRCRTIALELDPEEIIRISCAVNARGKDITDVPQGYYGNAFLYPAVASKAKLVCEKNSLGYAVEQVKKAKAQLTAEYVSSFADLMALKGRPMFEMGRADYIVSDLRLVTNSGLDFGWGKALYSGPAMAVDIISFLTSYKNSKGVEGFVVTICLPEPAMERFLEEVKEMTASS